jgi:hypothetical protein
MRRFRPLVLLLWLLSVAACAASPHARLGEDLAPLRDAFNAAAGRTRVLMLVAPT